jgi:hypothetical protein
MSPLPSFAAGFALGVRADVLSGRLVAAPAMSVAAAGTAHPKGHAGP